MNGAVERFDEGAPAARAIGYGRPSSGTANAASSASIRGCCTGASRSSSSSRCCPGSRSTRRGCFRALTPLFGGGAMTRLLHPWFSLGFVVVFALQFLNWLRR